MVSVHEATEIISAHHLALATRQATIDRAQGCVLAEPVLADRDLPPFDRVTMDGIAVKWSGDERRFSITGLQRAGEPRLQLNASGDAIEIMTGAALPYGADTVIRYEDLQLTAGSALVLDGVTIDKGQNIHYQGQDAKAKSVLLAPPMVLSPAEIALLAAVGKPHIAVVAWPRVAVVSTGDELVEVGAVPGPHQIRRSNSYALQAALLQMGCEAEHFHLPDNAAQLEKGIARLLADYPLVIFSGGVSKGKFDFVPGVLEKLDVEKKIHTVNQRPGKPFWFGASEKNTVFALPGNPVSTYMCFYRYIRPWLWQCAGIKTELCTATLAEDVKFGPPLTYFMQVSVRTDAGKVIARPVPGGGSGDFANLRDVDGFLELPADRSLFRAGEVFPYYPFRKH